MAEPASKKKKSVLELFKTITYGRYDGLSGTLELPAPPQRKKMKYFSIHTTPNAPSEYPQLPNMHSNPYR